MTLLAEAAAHLRARDVPFALIGAGAMAVHGVARSTVDLDLLVTSAACLSATFWDTMRATGAETIVRAGDAADPLAGVVRLRRGSDDPVDVVVGHARWQAAAITRARTSEVAGVRVPVVTAADLILLKLYAGGPQDLWDIAQLLGGDERHTIARDVEARLSALPADCARLWAEVSRAR